MWKSGSGMKSRGSFDLVFLPDAARCGDVLFGGIGTSDTTCAAPCAMSRPPKNHGETAVISYW